MADNLTDTKDISETAPRFSPDGKLLAISYKPKTSPTPDIALLDLATGKVRNVTYEQTRDHPWSFVAWSLDGKSFYANRTYIGGTDGDVYRVDIGSGKRENLTAHQGHILFADSSLSQDGRTLVIGTNKSGFDNVALLDTKSHNITPVTDTQWKPSRAILHRAATHSRTCSTRMDGPRSI